MTNITWTLLAAMVAVASEAVVCAVFETPFAETSIDWLSFAAGAFLAIEGIYKILKFRNDPLSIQFCRSARVMVGGSVFLVHLAEFFLGPWAPETASPLLGMIIDWSALSFGIFLMIEGMIRLNFHTRYSIPDTRYQIPGDSPADQMTRLIRVAIGSCMAMIHMLQFMR